MYVQPSSSRLLSAFVLLSSFVTSTLSTRTIKICKHRGDNGNAEICAAINTFYNTTTESTDYYLTLQTYRYKSSKKGWAAFGYGEQMKGALMFIIYGDPEAPYGALTTTVRSADSHHPPHPLPDEEIYVGPIPEIEVVSAQWKPYEGTYWNPKVELTPSHVGTAEIICYSCGVWQGFEINNVSTSQQMIWATNSVQEFQEDFSPDRSIEAHMFGLGFGMLWTDVLNSRVDVAGFPQIDDISTGTVGLTETGVAPKPPGEEEAYGAIPGSLPVELGNGDAVDYYATNTDADHDHDHDTYNADDPYNQYQDDPVDDTGSPTDLQSGAAAGDSDSPEQPAPTLMGKTIRDWMWHLHGLIMCLAFLVLYPLGAVMIRSGWPRAFNLHWTTQSFASLLVLISAGIGYTQSSSISVVHQYVGMGIVGALGLQTVLGWRHHAAYLRLQRKTWMSGLHVWSGRGIFAAAAFNMFSGLMLRQYGHAVIFGYVAAVAVELIALIYLLGNAKIRALALGHGRSAKGITGAPAPPVGAEAEEYFQLVGEDDDEDDLSDDGRQATNAAGMTRAEEKRDQARRLAALDKV